MPGMSSLGHGMAICLDDQAATPGTEHYIAQTTADNRITDLADHPDNLIPGTVPLGYAIDSGLMGIAAARPECLDAAITAMEGQHAGNDFRRRVSGVKGANTEPALSVLSQEL